jgi:AraC family transcriptional regulator
LKNTSASRRDYEQRIHRVMDHICNHLGEDLTLDELAGVAAFSPYHFHRLFTAFTGEPVGAFIRRVRLERTAFELTSHPARSVTEIALRNGFDSSAVFARAFRERFAMSATEWRAGRSKECKADRSPDQAIRNGSEATSAPPGYALPCWVVKPSRRREEKQMEVRLEEMTELRAAYIRRMGEYRISAGEAWDTLCRWAGPRGLLTPGRMLFSISHDDPAVTAPEKLRYDACIALDANSAVDEQIGIVTLPARRVAKARYVGPGSGISGAYQELYGEWLPESGFVPGDTPPIEIYLTEEGNLPEVDHFVMDICIPVVPA